VYQVQMRLAGRALAIFSVAVLIVVAWAYTLGKLSISSLDSTRVTYEMRDAAGSEKTRSEEISIGSVHYVVGRPPYPLSPTQSSKLDARVIDVTKLPLSDLRFKGVNSNVTTVKQMPKKRMITILEYLASPDVFYGPHGERLKGNGLTHHWFIQVLGHDVDLRELFGLAIILITLLALVLGTALGADADLRLALAKTRPVSTTAYAALTHAINVAAVTIAACVAFAGLIVPPLIHTGFYSGDVSAKHAVAMLATVVLAGLAWYAFTAALTTTRRILTGVISLAMVWAIALLMAAQPDYVTLGPFETVHGVINALNPFWHAETLKTALSPQVSWGDIVSGPQAQPLQIVSGLAALLGLAVSGTLVSIFRWVRIEA
jgi:hypothetical protein